MAGDDKHLFKQFCQEGQPHVLEALSPPQTTGISPSRYERPTSNTTNDLCWQNWYPSLGVFINSSVGLANWGAGLGVEALPLLQH